jgi:serine/threonine protein phosphatase PrpC
MIGVMDGHGTNGHNASQFVKQNLPNILNGLMSGLTNEQLITADGPLNAKSKEFELSNYFPSLVKSKPECEPAVKKNQEYESGD